MRAWRHVSQPASQYARRRFIEGKMKQRPPNRGSRYLRLRHQDSLHMTTSRSAGLACRHYSTLSPCDPEEVKEHRAAWAPIFMPSSWRSWRPIHFCEGFLQKSTAHNLGSNVPAHPRLSSSQTSRPAEPQTALPAPPSTAPVETFCIPSATTDALVAGPA